MLTRRYSVRNAVRLCLLLALVPQLARTDRSSSAIASKHSNSLELEVDHRGTLHHSTGHQAKQAARSCGGTCAEQKARSSSSIDMVPGIGVGKDMMKLMAVCFICVIAYKLLSKIDCNQRKYDCRRCRCIARQLLAWGYDEFEGTQIGVQVHSVSDIKKDGLFGDKEFKVKVNFSWSKWETSGTTDLRWEQAKIMEVPQGASECSFKLLSLGKFKDTAVASYVLETKKDLLDKGEDIFGKKQKLKLESKGKVVGTLAVTFRNAGDGDSCGVPVSGVDDDSALAIEIMKELEELEATPGFVKPEGKWEGAQKVFLLSKVLEGDLREVKKNGKEDGKSYVRVIQCNYAQLQGEDMKEEWKKQVEKAKKKGLSEPEKKWYWVWYEDKKAAHDDKKWMYPDGFIPMTSISKVNRSPDRNDQFIVTYSDDGKKEHLIYRRDAGKSLDAWVEGLEACFQEVRAIVKGKKEGEAQKDQALQRMRQMHAQWVQQNGYPKDEEAWGKWFEWYKQSNYDEDLIKALYGEISSQHQAAQNRQQQMAKQQAGKAAKKR